MFSLFSQMSQLGICLLQGRYFLLLSPECGMKLQRETHDYYSLTQLVKYVITPNGQSYVQWTSFYVFADVEKTSTEEPEWKFLGRLFLTCSARLI